MDALLAELTAICGPDQVLTDPGVTAGYATDWTRRFAGRARCVIRPGGTDEVAAALLACGRRGVPVVPQGGNTGLVGGGVPVGGDAVVLSARRLRRLDPVDTLSGQVTAGAGVTIAELRAHAARAGLEYGVDLAARDSATVGGTIATNAGGIQTIRYGPTRAQLLGLEAVLADGSVISRLGGIQADNTGYDLTQLIAGSEGTLAVITAARFRLWPAEPSTLTVLAGVPDIEAAAALQAQIRSLVPAVRAAEYFEAAGLALVRAHTGLPAPLERDYPAYLLADAATSDEDAERLVVLPPLQDAAVAMDAQARAGLWAYRERHTESISAEGIPHKLDVAVPLARIAAFRAELDSVIAKAARGAEADARAIVFGHIGAGNLHVNVLGPAPGDDSVDDAVFRLAAEHGGTISAEHGIGRAKAAVLHLSRSAAEIAAMRAVKSALDPAGLLNPGVLFPP
ncbi:MAG TPA: FAD-binding oxidoreductase [Streptosporangiaceae bacterium]|nr:FAD-binding oxidoreductase [Streptosporangiaceae bacterium]